MRLFTSSLSSTSDICRILFSAVAFRNSILLSTVTLFVNLHLSAQVPFYTDDPATTDVGTLHVEFFNEHDALQLQYPNSRQNTANLKLNYGLKDTLEVDVDLPYLAIYRSAGNSPYTGVGDLNLGVKERFHDELAGSHLPALAASFYIELPTGDASKQLGSGIADYWLNLVLQKTIKRGTKLTGNVGYLFAGNTSTGALGTTQGHIVPAGVSLQHDFSSKLTLGGELYGAYTADQSLAKAQLQSLVGGRYSINKILAIDFGVLGGKFVASPKLGAQFGFTLDFPLF